MNKQSQTPFLNRQSKNKELLEIIYADICWLMRDKTMGDSRYFALFIDDYSRCWVNFLSNKPVFAALKEYAAYAKNFTGRKTKNLGWFRLIDSWKFEQ